MTQVSRERNPEILSSASRGRDAIGSWGSLEVRRRALRSPPPSPARVPASTWCSRGRYQAAGDRGPRKGWRAERGGVTRGREGGKAEPPRGPGSPLGRRPRARPTFPEGHRAGTLRGRMARDTRTDGRPSGSPEAPGGLRAMGPAREGKGTYLVTAWHVTARRRLRRGAGSAGVASPVSSGRLRAATRRPGWATWSGPEPRGACLCRGQAWKTTTWKEMGVSSSSIRSFGLSGEGREEF